MNTYIHVRLYACVGGPPHSRKHTVAADQRKNQCDEEESGDFKPFLGVLKHP